MIVVDTSVWIEHLRTGGSPLGQALVAGHVLGHAFVIGELACGNLRNRAEILALLRELPEAPVAEHDEVLAFIDLHHLTGIGIGWIDAHLLAATCLVGARLWTRDRDLREAARISGVALMPG